MSRCYTLYQAYCFAKKYNISEVSILWRIEPACGGRFNDVFERKNEFWSEVKDIDIRDANYHETLKKKEYVRIPWVIGQKIIYSRSYRYIYSLQEKYKRLGGFYDLYPPRDIGYTGENYYEYDRNMKALISKKASLNGNVFINAYCGFTNENFDIPIKEVIHFRKEFLDEAESILAEDLRKHCIGIHIRRTDHEVTKRESKTEYFVKKINEILNEENNPLFYLSTDDPKEESDLKTIFGNRIFSQTDKKWGRETGDGIKGAIIDVVCLSRCKYILGSFGSVFSNFAAQYGNVELYVCNNDEPGHWIKTFDPL